MGRAAHGIRYYTEDDATGITPSQLKRLGRKKQQAYLRHWFDTYHEDPVQETPRMDGEYVYPWGGPYDASDALQTEFSDLVDYRIIGEVVEDLEKDGTTDWAPTSRHPDYTASIPDKVDATDTPANTISDVLSELRDGAIPRLGTPEELSKRDFLRRQVAALEAELARARTMPPGVGHNDPLRDSEDPSGPTLAEAEAIVREISTELKNSEPNLRRVVEATSKLSQVASWFGKRVEKATERSVENLIAWGPTVVAADLFSKTLPTIVVMIHQIEATCIRWAEVALRFFSGL